MELLSAVQGLCIPLSSLSSRSHARQAFAEEQVGTWGRMLAPAANREQVDSALATLIDVGNSPQ